MSSKRQSITAPDLQFGDNKLDRLMQFVRSLATEVQGLQQMLRAGSSGQVLEKSTSADYDAGWVDANAAAISGGKNLGSGAAVFKDVEGTLLAFRSLAAGANIGISVGESTITITAAGSTGGSGTVTSVGITSADLSVTGSPIGTSGVIELEIKPNVVAYAKMQKTSTDAVVLGRKLGDGAGNVEELGPSDLAAIIGTSGYAKQLAYAGIT